MAALEVISMMKRDLALQINDVAELVKGLELNVIKFEFPDTNKNFFFSIVEQQEYHGNWAFETYVTDM
jgi:hypothetical protein